MSESMPQHPEAILLTAFADGELPAREAQSIQQHLNTCHACTLQVLRITQLKSATARAAQRYAAYPSTAKKWQHVPDSTNRCQMKWP